jgi:two-component system sensor histidine kinase BarA
MESTVDRAGSPYALVVDDDMPSRILAKSVLELFGVAAEICENGALGAAAFAKTRYDIVFMDNHMPELSGIDATQCMRAYEKIRRLPRTPIIAITASGMSAEKMPV